MATLGAIRADVRRNLGEGTARFYTDAELNQFIGEAYKKYSIMMIEEGDGYFQTTLQIAIVANTAAVSVAALTPMFFSVGQLFKNTSYAQVPLQEDEMRFVANSPYLVGAGDSYLPRWRLRGTNIILQPTPQSSEAAGNTTGLQLDYNYLPTFPVAASVDVFTFDTNFSTIYEPLIQLYATIAALESKDGMGGVSDIQSFRDRKGEWEQVLLDSLMRSEGPDRVQYMGSGYNMNNWRS